MSQEASDPTELAGAADAETQSAYAWSAAEDYPATGSWADPERRWTPRRLTLLALATAVAAVVGATTLGFSLLRDREQVTHVVVATATATATAVVTVAPPVWTAAHDRRFVENLQSEGLSVWDWDATIKQARGVCADLRRGLAPNAVIQQLAKPGSKVTLQGAQVFVTTAMQTYPGCP